MYRHACFVFLYNPLWKFHFPTSYNVNVTSKINNQSISPQFVAKFTITINRDRAISATTVLNS